MSSVSEDVLGAARAYLEQRGYTAAVEALETRPRDIKLNDMLQRDAAQMVRRYALHVEPSGASYEEGYEQLSAWISRRPVAE